MAAFKV